MNQPSDNHPSDPVSPDPNASPSVNSRSSSQSGNGSDARDQAHDQLIDWGLRAQADTSPAPEFTDQILAAAHQQPDATCETNTPGRKSQRWSARHGAMLCLAALILLCLAGLYRFERPKPTNGLTATDTLKNQPSNTPGQPDNTSTPASVASKAPDGSTPIDPATSHATNKDRRRSNAASGHTAADLQNSESGSIEGLATEGLATEGQRDNFDDNPFKQSTARTESTSTRDILSDNASGPTDPDASEEYENQAGLSDREALRRNQNEKRIADSGDDVTVADKAETPLMLTVTPKIISEGAETPTDENLRQSVDFVEVEQVRQPANEAQSSLAGDKKIWKLPSQFGAALGPATDPLVVEESRLSGQRAIPAQKESEPSDPNESFATDPMGPGPGPGGQGLVLGRESESKHDAQVRGEAGVRLTRQPNQQSAEGQVQQQQSTRKEQLAKSLDIGLAIPQPLAGQALDEGLSSNTSHLNSVLSKQSKSISGANRETARWAVTRPSRETTTAITDRELTDANRVSLIDNDSLVQPIARESAGERYAPIHENPFVPAKGTDAVSTFSIDVDTAAYTNVRKFLRDGQLPPANAVRLEEMLNYFDYAYAGPDADSEDPFATHTEVTTCPWNRQHQLVRVAIKGREIAPDKRPLSNIVFLIDVSGSMNNADKLPLVIDGLSQMTRNLGENDRVAIVVYAGSEGLALPSTGGDQQEKILAQLQRLSAGGSTAGGAGIQLAYKVAEENFIQGATNRVILCTDGDFNVGVSNTDELERLAEAKAAETGVFLTVLGFGRGNLNDEMMERISNRGNGTYHYIDSLREARRVLVQQVSSTLVTIAKDVKIQIEFNPANVAAYRLLGYENRKLARHDFDDDTKDAGEVGAGHTVTALYEVIPNGIDLQRPDDKADAVEPLRYQSRQDATPDDKSDADPSQDAANQPPEFTEELLMLRLRYKQPDEHKSTKIEVALKKPRPEDCAFDNASQDMRFATAVAGFGMLLRNSRYKGDATFQSVRAIAENALGQDIQGYRAEMIELIDAADRLRRR